MCCFANFLKICVLKQREPEKHTFALFVNMEKIHLSETNSFFYLAQFTKLFFFFFLESHTKSVHLYLVRLLPQVNQCPQATFEICRLSDCEFEGK